MSKFYDRTAMGGPIEVFQTTCWSDIHDAGSRDKALRTAIIDKLLRQYWKPVYCYLRRKGYSNESAKDLTQGFFHEVVLGRELIQKADETKGRFRTFLLAALDRYVANVYRKETASKRSPTDIIVKLQDSELPDLPKNQSQAKPEQVFHYAWASQLLDQVLTRLKDECYRTGKEIHWEIFNARVLAPIFDIGQTPSIAELCAKYGIDSETQASNMIITVKRRFRATLQRCLRQFVQSDSEVQTEFNELMKILSKGGAG
jgi:RNA polymerase sigma-70 factor (ECF subfamily)